MKIRIDVIIPSFRLAEKYILPILQLSKPSFSEVKFYLVSDNPGLIPSEALQQRINNQDVLLLQNDANYGAAASRNRGIDAGDGEWILFLDDDIIVADDLLDVYTNAIKKSPNATGFIGLTKFPEPVSSFTKAIWASGSMDIFSIALRKKDFAWGATVNSMVRRSAIGTVRFSEFYPKAGGGEDIDFFLRVRENNNFENLKALPAAVVQHPWWNNGEPDFKRPFRYGRGNSWLGQLNPRYTYRDFLNTPETLLIMGLLIVLLVILKSSLIIPAVWFTVGVLGIEIVANAIQIIKRKRAVGLQIIFYVMMLRLVYETGVLWGKLSRGYVQGIGLRFHDNGVINKKYFYRLNTYKTVKCILYIVLILLLAKF